MRIVVNPGSGPVEGATEEHAQANIRHFLTDCDDGERADRWRAVRYADGDLEGEGRYSFLLWRNNRCHLVAMPGLPLDQVRYIGEGDQRIGDFPRLYVDGSSWIWKFALGRFGDDEELEL